MMIERPREIPLKRQRQLSRLPLSAVIKIQAVARGYIARNIVERVYGYSIKKEKPQGNNHYDPQTRIERA